MDRKYTIDSCLDFQTGRLPDGRQVLLGLLCPVASAIVFSPEGDYQEVLERALVFLKRRPNGIFDTYDERIKPEIELWKLELGWMPRPIVVKKFAVDNLGVRVEDYPTYFEDLDAPTIAADEREELTKSKAEWDREGMYVLWWGKDYWMASDGSVDST